MNLALLGGMNSTNSEWVNNVKATVEGQFDDAQVLEYLHWQNTELTMNVAVEAERLAEMVESWEEYAVFAKSAGTWVVLKAVQDGLITPKSCIFTGIAVNFAPANNIPINDLLEGYSVPTLFVQQTADPAIGYQELGMLLSERHVANYEVVEVPGDDHHYSNVAQLGEFILTFTALSSSPDTPDRKIRLLRDDTNAAE